MLQPVTVDAPKAASILSPIDLADIFGGHLTTRKPLNVLWSEVGDAGTTGKPGFATGACLGLSFPVCKMKMTLFWGRKQLYAYHICLHFISGTSPVLFPTSSIFIQLIFGFL